MSNMAEFFSYLLPTTHYLLTHLFAPKGLIPHGHCYLWNPQLVGLHVISDAVIAIAYYSIPITLFYLIRKRQDLPFNWVFVLFGAFIVACGTTHILGIWTLWHPDYWLSGTLKAIAALISLYTAVELVRLLPQALTLPSPAQWETANWALQRHIIQCQQVETALRQSEERYRAIVEDQTELVCRFLPDGTFTFVNQAYCRFFGRTQAELIGRSYTPIVLDEDVEKVKGQLSGLSAEHPVTTITNRVVRPNGEICTQQWINRGIFDEENRLVELQAVGRDITELKRTEEALQISRARLAGILDIADDAIISIDSSQRITLFNKGAEKIFGYQAPEVIDQPLSILLPARFAAIHRQHIVGFAWSPEKARRMGKRGEIFGCRKDGTEFPAEASISQLELEGEKVFTVFLRDITERKQAEVALQRAYDDLEVRVQERTQALSKANKDLQLEIALRIRVEAELQIRIRQQAAVARLGQQALADYDLTHLLHQACAITAQTLEIEYCQILELLPNGEALLLRAGLGWQAELVGSTTVSAGPDSQAGYTLLLNRSVIVEDLQTEVRFSSSPLLHDGGIVSGMSVVIPGQNCPFGVLEVHTTQQRKFTQDDAYFLQAIANVLATAINRQQAENHIQASLKEKEVLLKEIHHRVKNNLQVICSLLGLQSRSLQDPSTIAIFQESQNRVRSMALIHEKLYRSKDMSSIDFADYIRDLVKNLLRSYNTHSDAIALITDISPNIFLDIDVAIPCGLIINELVSNCLKHAFPETTPGIVCIRFYPEPDDTLVLMVSDNGIGLPPDFDFKSTKSLGLKLVNGLIHQIRGTLEVDRRNGSEFRIQFPGHKTESAKSI